MFQAQAVTHPDCHYTVTNTPLRTRWTHDRTQGQETFSHTLTHTDRHTHTHTNTKRETDTEHKRHKGNPRLKSILSSLHVRHLGFKNPYACVNNSPLQKHPLNTSP